jgi:beta-lactamase class D
MSSSKLSICYSFLALLILCGAVDKAQDISYFFKDIKGAFVLYDLKRDRYIGYVETDGNVYFFALNMEGTNFAAIRDRRIELTQEILRALGCLPPK